MANETNSGGPDSIASTKRSKFFYPFRIIFHGICNIMSSLSKPSALRLENDALRARIDSRKGELKTNSRRNKCLKELNSTLSAKVKALELDSDGIQDILASMELQIRARSEKIDDQKECAERLEKHLQNTKQKNSELDTQFKKEESLMDGKKREWKFSIDELNEKNHLFEAKLRMQDSMVRKRMRYIADAEVDLGQIKAIDNMVRSKKEKLEQEYNKVEEKNRELKDEIKNLMSEEDN